jgi:hypothetical protein
MDEHDRFYHFAKRTDKTFVSRSFRGQLTGETLRIASKVIDGGEGLTFGKVGDEVVLRATPAGRYEIKATFLEDSRGIKVLNIQKFNAVSGPSDHVYFSLVGREIRTLLEFILSVRTLPLDDENKINLHDSTVRSLILNDTQAKRVFFENEDLFIRIAQSESLKRDLIAVGYRRKQLERFESLLHDNEFFESQMEETGLSAEKIWQSFFEANTWIFGYGLSYQFLTNLDGKKLEQITTGHDLLTGGKRADALMKTQALISSLSFVEIKTHQTALLAGRQYRSDTWAPSVELSGGIAQVQATVQGALEHIGRSFSIRDKEGSPTGELLFNIAPKSFLVIGSLAEFQTEHGPNELKFRAFEVYRRNILHPEIITFDELLYRARFIVEHGPQLG